MSKIPNIPSSNSKEFWEGAEVIKSTPEQFHFSPRHNWIQQGNMAFCTSCPDPHGIFLNIQDEEVREGQIFDLKKNIFKHI
jgi:hypothetical protein